jgi:hypothetical protein
MKTKLFFLLLISINLFAQSAGETGLSFLKNGFGARNIAMGDFGVVGNNDLSALYYNPSLLAVDNKSQITFTHNSLFQDENSEMLGASFNAFGLPFAVGVNTTTVSGIEVRTTPGDPQAIFSAHDFAGSISTAYKFSDNIYAGASYKYLYEGIYTNQNSGYGLDFGLTYARLINGLTIGASYRNIGSMNILKNDPTVLPTDLMVGASYNYPLPDSKMDFTILTGYQNYTKENESHIHIGGEFVYDHSFSLRAGYITNYETKSVSVGFGVFWKGINLDYAYVPNKYELGDSHIITMIYSFN